ncbi:MAG: hypothetical protein QW341_01000 [Candidatus Bathyarchaeia archaeon]
MSFTNILAELDREIASSMRRREALKTLFSEGKVSQRTFNILSKEMVDIEAAAINMKEKIEGSIKFWKAVASEEARILENLLVDFRFKSLIGELNEEGWRSISTIIGLGIDSINAFADKMGRIAKSNADLKANSPSRKRRNNTSLSPSQRRAELKSSDGSRCMNPWKPNCGRTEIRLSIYYNGRILPICDECWKEISEKNIEWTE